MVDVRRPLAAITPRSRTAALAEGRVKRSLGVETSIQRDADRGEFRDFSAAEQAAMAAQSVIVAFDTAGKLDEAKAKRLTGLVDRVYATLEKEDNYQMTNFTGALRNLTASAQ